MRALKIKSRCGQSLFKVELKRHCLIAREDIPLERIEVVLSHPQPSAQCARFIRENLPQAEVRAAPSTAEAVRTVAESDEAWAALGAESAARLYGAAVLRHGVEDEPDNITRFVWVAPEGTTPSGSDPWRTARKILLFCIIES